MHKCLHFRSALRMEQIYSVKSRAAPKKFEHVLEKKLEKCNLKSFFREVPAVLLLISQLFHSTWNLLQSSGNVPSRSVCRQSTVFPNFGHSFGRDREEIKPSPLTYSRTPLPRSLNIFPDYLRPVLTWTKTSARI